MTEKSRVARPIADLHGHRAQIVAAGALQVGRKKLRGANNAGHLRALAPLPGTVGAITETPGERFDGHARAGHFQQLRRLFYERPLTKDITPFFGADAVAEIVGENDIEPWEQ